MLEQANNMESMGGADTDVIEMELYDDFREMDGELSTIRYLSKCRDKLMKKTCIYREEINQLQKQLDKVRLESKEEKERIRDKVRGRKGEKRGKTTKFCRKFSENGKKEGGN